MIQIHELKIDKNYLKSKLDGDKLFEIRVNDRGYQKGDTVLYTEMSSLTKKLVHEFEITYVTSFMQQGQYCVFGEKYIKTEVHHYDS